MTKRKCITALPETAGFTLLEVMVAVAVIAISFVTLLGSQSQSISLAGRSRFDVTSALLAQQQLSEIEATDFDQVFSSSGDFGENYPGYTWRSEVSDLGEDESGIEDVGDMLKMVNLTVSLGESESLSYTVSTVLIRTPGSGS